MSVTFRPDKGGHSFDEDLEINLAQSLAESLLEELGGGIYSQPPYNHGHGDTCGRVVAADLPTMLMHVSILMGHATVMVRDASITPGPGMQIYNCSISEERVLNVLSRLQLLITQSFARGYDVAWC